MNCQHTNADHNFPTSAKPFEHFICLDCAELLSLGDANIGPDAAIELRAALLSDPTRLGGYMQFNGVESQGWSGEETIDLIVVGRDGKRRKERDVPLNLDSPAWQAGYLARCIAEHMDARALLHFVVNGEVVSVDAPPQEPLHGARDRALVQSFNTGRPVDDWEMREESGILISDLSRPVNAYGFGPDTRLYLTLVVGAGGNS